MFIVARCGRLCSIISPAQRIFCMLFSSSISLDHLCMSFAVRVCWNEHSFEGLLSYSGCKTVCMFWKLLLLAFYFHVISMAYYIDLTCPFAVSVVGVNAEARFC